MRRAEKRGSKRAASCRALDDIGGASGALFQDVHLVEEKPLIGKGTKNSHPAPKMGFECNNSLKLHTTDVYNIVIIDVNDK